MLYIVATPIGNLKDITLRALETLQACDLIACEDTRRTLKLLNRHNIKKPLVSYREHNREQAGPVLLDKARQGLVVCLVSDAGTPGISDPGEELVRLFHENGIPVTEIPGPCALVSGLVLSGLPSGKFVFEGFLDSRGKERDRRLEELRKEKRTLVFYEAPHRILKTLEAMAAAFGTHRKAAIARELTKIHEEVIRGELGEIIARFRQAPPKGEMVVVVEGSPLENEKTLPEKGVVEAYEELLKLGFSRKEAMGQISEEYGLSRREIYNKVNRL
ncbi:MAG: 16S rRNA (cytidine(1402)-2'-O)-methyltransferase [Clostridia bacterium]